MNARSLYQGKIERLLLFAGPSRSGKSTFLKDPSTHLDHAQQPAAFRDIDLSDIPHINVNDLKNSTQRTFDTLILHTDFTVPFRNLARQYPTWDRKLLQAALRPQIFNEWPALQAYTSLAQRLEIITFFVRRRVHFERWLDSYITARGNQVYWPVNPIVLAIYADTGAGDALHRAMYRAWMGFAEQLRPRAHYVLDGNSHPYRFLTPEELMPELDSGYIY